MSEPLPALGSPSYPPEAFLEGTTPKSNQRLAAYSYLPFLPETA